MPEADGARGRGWAVFFLDRESADLNGLLDRDSSAEGHEW